MFNPICLSTVRSGSSQGISREGLLGKIALTSRNILLPYRPIHKLIRKQPSLFGGKSDNHHPREGDQERLTKDARIAKFVHEDLDNALFVIPTGGMDGDATRFVDDDVLVGDFVEYFDGDGGYWRFVAMDDVF